MVFTRCTTGGVGGIDWSNERHHYLEYAPVDFEDALPFLHVKHFVHAFMRMHFDVVSRLEDRSGESRDVRYLAVDDEYLDGSESHPKGCEMTFPCD